MKRYLVFMLLVSSAFAQEPVITHDVHVIQNTTPQNCKSTWSGTGDPVMVQNLTSGGIVNTVAPGILSCKGCAYDQSSGDCICKTCVEEYN